ncbi:MAG TPA: alpha/beta hydrolase [Gemmatimonadales bacterium]|nr:alpha/beta hydrolase [Gemmatimonadales bacterium]
MAILRRGIMGLAVVLAGAVAYGALKNPERATLDAAARTGAPGRFVGSSHGVTHYDVAGPDTGRVVLLVHGFSVPAYIWDSTFTALSAAGFRTIRYDLFGRGWSDRPDAAYDGPLYDAQIDELLDSLHVTTPVDLVGLSFGGLVTAHYTVGHRARVRTLTLVDPASTSSPLPTLLKLPVVGRWIWQTTRVPSMADNQASDFLHPEHFPTWADQYRPQMRFKGFGRALLRSVVTSSRTNFDSLYAGAARTGVPVLLIWGKQDQTVPIAESEVERRTIPQLEFFPVDSAGHLPHIEQSAMVHARMLAFFAAHPGS